ncbi:hypothetical protein OR16_07771 [Cupriavidus basilensis OR16]|uniref:Uncharacterized protein n=1 Tax=Cupriavidus basilensis OR16 TaxID=1127483 RepID=H1S1L3_9BURK|nr:hypothetical protein [Cupriavidus basilensis]EHP43588.1 hypothetical protein OR16_07771 [Cupriavidus basilensis OR16]
MSQAVESGTCQAIIAGRVEEVTALENGGFDTAIALPAEDEFSSPGFVHVYSEKRIGQKGEMVRQVVKVSGFRQRIQGKQGMWIKYTNVLRAVQ